MALRKLSGRNSAQPLASGSASKTQNKGHGRWRRRSKTWQWYVASKAKSAMQRMLRSSALARWRAKYEKHHPGNARCSSAELW